MLKLSFLGVLVLSLFVSAQDDAKKTDDTLKGVKCVVMTKAAVKKEKHTAYRDAEVYFCCDKCKAAFEKDSSKHAVGANQQLVQTKQYVQKNCPISGQAIDEAQKTKVGETEVAFCCDQCLGKVKSAKDDAEKAKLVFSDEAFDKAFVKAESSDKEEKKGDKEGSAPAKKSGL